MVSTWQQHCRPAFALCFCLLLFCGCQSEPAATHTLVILSPHREEIRYEVEQGFKAWLAQKPEWPGEQVQIEWRDIGGGTSQMLRYLDGQYRANPKGVGIDLLFGGGTDPYLTLKEAKRLEKYDLPDELRRKIPQKLHGVDLYDKEGYWFGVMLSSLGIFSNRKALEMLGLPDWQAKSWKDLGDPRLFGTVTAGDPRTSGSVRMLYELILQTYGWEEGFRQLLRLGANTRTFARFSDGVTKDVVFGRAAVGGSLDSYAFSAMTREQRDLADGLAGEAILDFIFPPGEVMLNPDSIGILKGAPHRKLAEAFVEYNLSEDGGQRLWMLQPNTLPGSPQRYAICRLGVMPDLYDTQTFPLTVRSVTINPFDEVQVGKLVEYDNQLADSRRFLMQDLFGAWIIDSHDELSAAWRAVLRTRTQTPDPLEETLFAPPCSHQEIPALVAQMRKGPRRRAELQTHWLAEARQRYRQVRVAAEER